MSADGAASVALLLTDAVVLPMADAAPGEADWFRGWLAVDGVGRVAGLGPGEPPVEMAQTAGEVRDLGGAFLAPGFISAHSHLFTSGMRGIASGSTLYPWVQSMMEVMAGCDAEDLYWFTFHGSLDFLANGITSAYNFTQSRVTWMYDPATGTPRPDTVHPLDYLIRQFDAAVDAGLRVVHAIRLDDEIDEDDRAIMATFDTLASAAVEHTPDDQLLGVSVMGAVQWASGPRTAHLEVRAMHEHGITNQAHFVETAEGLDLQRSKFDWYVKAGALGPSMLFGHFIHPTDDMVAAVAQTGASMVWQPTSNGRLGSGLADVVRYRREGIGVGVGLDDQSCTDISDPFANMRMGLYGIRALHTDASILMPRDVLRMHTVGSAEVLGVADRVGSLEVGKMADFLVVDPTAPDTGPVWDVYGTYVLACGLRNLKEVYVGGRLVSSGGVCTAATAGDAPAQVRTRIGRAARDAGLTMDMAPV